MVEEELNLYKSDDFDLSFDDMKSYHINRTAIEIPKHNQRKLSKGVLKQIKRKGQKLQQNSVNTKQPRTQLDELDEYEMFFYSRAIDREIIQSISVSSRLSMQNYSPSQRTPAQARQVRQNMDKRYKNKKNSKNEKIEQILCRGHLTDNCHRIDCQQIHQMRLPRRMRVCKFYVGGECKKHGNCVYLHSEFPCKFYYLGYPHPKHPTSDKKCRFSHGGPLSKEMKENFLRYLENSLRSKLMEQKEKNCDEVLHSRMRDIVERINYQQEILLNETQSRQQTEAKSAAVSPSENLLESILSDEQINRLRNDGLKDLAQIKRITKDQWKKYGISVEQMLRIQCKAIRDGIFGNDPVAKVDRLFQINTIRDTVSSSESERKSINIDSVVMKEQVAANLTPDKFEESQDLAQFLAADLGKFFKFDKHFLRS